MSTILVDPVASERLTRQFEAAVRRAGGQDAATEARRFVGYLCDRLERNNHLLMAAPRNRRPDIALQAAMAARQGESVLLTCHFLLHDLAVRLGRPQIAEYLAATQTRAGRALARRVLGRAMTDVRIVRVRFGGEDNAQRAREIAAVPAPFAGTNGISSTYRFRGMFPGVLKPALVIENEGFRTATFVAAHMRLFARYAEAEPWQATGGDAFAFLEKVNALESQVIALRGFDCMDLLRGADSRRRDPIAINILARLI